MNKDDPNLIVSVARFLSAYHGPVVLAVEILLGVLAVGGGTYYIVIREEAKPPSIEDTIRKEAQEFQQPTPREIQQINAKIEQEKEETYQKKLTKDRAESRDEFSKFLENVEAKEKERTERTERTERDKKNKIDEKNKDEKE